MLRIKRHTICPKTSNRNNPVGKDMPMAFSRND